MISEALPRCGVQGEQAEVSGGGPGHDELRLVDLNRFSSHGGGLGGVGAEKVDYYTRPRDSEGVKVNSS